MKSFAGSITALFVAGMVGGYAGLCLLGPTDESQTAVAAARVPDPPALPCSMQAWPNADRKCLEWTAPRAEAAATATTDGSQKAGAVAPSLDKRATTAASPSTVGMGVANRPAPAAVPAAERDASETAPPAEQPVTAAAKVPTSKSQQTARARSKALAVVRGFGDNLNGVPVNAYAYEGGRRSGGRTSASQDRYYGARARGWWW